MVRQKQNWEAALDGGRLRSIDLVWVKEARSRASIAEDKGKRIIRPLSCRERLPLLQRPKKLRRRKKSIF